MYNLEYEQHMSRFRVIKSVLVEAQSYREFFPYDYNEGHKLPDWNTFEMLTVLREVNMFREALGKDMLGFSAIEKIEQQASGHVDYTRKFALYAAELILED